MNKKQILKILKKHSISSFTDINRKLTYVIEVNNLNNVAKEIKQLSGWVSVEDELPKRDAECLMINKRTNRPKVLQFYKDDTKEDLLAIGCTHWLPIPPLPEKKGGEG